MNIFNFFRRKKIQSATNEEASPEVLSIALTEISLEILPDVLPEIIVKVLPDAIHKEVIEVTPETVADDMHDAVIDAIPEAITKAVDEVTLVAGISTTKSFFHADLPDIVKMEIRKNVELIAELETKELDQIYDLVLKSVMEGRNLGGLRAALQSQFNMTKERAAQISRFQHNNATAMLTRIRQEELGIKEAMWIYSNVACAIHPKDPTPKEIKRDAAHRAANGKLYDVSKGMYLNRKWTWPGCEEGCKCISRSILPCS
jgi:uncharacterized protein with gpF-like domain